MSEQKILNHEDITKILPHRFPFLLIDRVILYSKEFVKAIKNVSANEPFFSGHFPDFAVMPGVLQIEAMAQCSGLILSCSNKFDKAHNIAFLAQIEEACFKKPVIPGDQLIIESSLIFFKRGILKCSAKILVSDELVCRAIITLAVRSK